MTRRQCWTTDAPAGRAKKRLDAAQRRLVHLDVLQGQYADIGVRPAKLRQAIRDAEDKYARQRAAFRRAEALTRRVCGAPPSSWHGTAMHRSSADAIADARRGAERERKRLKLPRVL